MTKSYFALVPTTCQVIYEVKRVAVPVKKRRSVMADRTILHRYVEYKF